jgi:hypothetical protein
LSLCGRLAAFLPVVALGVGAWVLYRAWSLPVPALERAAPAAGLPAAPLPSVEGLDGSVFRTEQAQAPVAQGELSRRFRLAGTFFAYGSGEGDT